MTDKIKEESSVTNVDRLPEFQHFDGIGDITVGGVVGSGDVSRLYFTSLAILNNPQVNAYLLANKLKLTDRFTKTVIFPRDGMVLPNNTVYMAEVICNEQS